MHILTNPAPPAKRIGERADAARKRGVAVPDDVPGDAVLSRRGIGTTESDGPFGKVETVGIAVEWVWYR